MPARLQESIRRIPLWDVADTRTRSAGWFETPNLHKRKRDEPNRGTDEGRAPLRVAVKRGSCAAAFGNRLEEFFDDLIGANPLRIRIKISKEAMA